MEAFAHKKVEHTKNKKSGQQTQPQARNISYANKQKKKKKKKAQMQYKGINIDSNK